MSIEDPEPDRHPEPRRFYIDVPATVPDTVAVGLYDEIAAAAHQRGLTAWLGAVPDALEDRMSQPDADRIIAAHREEARRTRRLLVWLLVGLPVLGLLVWGGIAIAASAGNTDGGDSCGSASTAAYIDLDACPLSGPALTDDSPCSDYTADGNQPGDTTKTNPAVYWANQHTVLDVVQFDTICANNPTESLTQALTQMGGG